MFTGQLLDWLPEYNESLGKKGIPPRLRAFSAIQAWSELTGASIALNSSDAQTLFKWFQSEYGDHMNLKSDSFVSVFLYDAIPVQMLIPHIYGTFALRATDCLVGLPKRSINMLHKDHAAMQELGEAFYGAVLYSLWIDDVKLILSSEFALTLANAADSDLRAAVYVFLEDASNVATTFRSREAAEKFMKAALAELDGLTESKVKKLSHDLNKGLERLKGCVGLSHSRICEKLKSEIEVFPPYNKRYEMGTLDPARNHRAFRAAQTVATCTLGMVMEIQGRGD